jgi:hypothetical protein
MRLLALFPLLLATSAWSATEYFPICDSAFERSEFAVLRDRLPSVPIQQPGRCMRLTDREFLVTANRKGPYNGSPANLFYCDLRTAEGGCVEDEPSHYYPELTLLRQFSGARDKQYVLWSTLLFRHGDLSSGYFIFNLAPKTSAPRGYVFYSLGIGTHIRGGSELSNDVCEGPDSADNSNVEVTGVDVHDEGTEAVTLAFEQVSMSCRTKSKSKETVNFVLKDGKFQRE